MKKWMHLTIKRSCPLVLFLNFKYHMLCVILKVNGLSFKIVCLSYNPLNYFYQSQTLKPSARRTYDEPLSILHKRLHRALRCIHLLASYILSWQALQIFFLGLVYGPFETAYPCFCDDNWVESGAKVMKTEKRGWV
jgi:hypothetical protein